MPDVPHGAQYPGLLPLLLVRGYASLGQEGRALDLLHRYRAQAERSEQPSQEATARIFLAWFLAYRGNRAAQWHADLAWDYFGGHVEHAHEVWLATVVRLWSAAANGQTAGRDGAAAILKLNPSTLNWRIDKLSRARGHRRR